MVTVVRMMGFTGELQRDVNPRNGRFFYRYQVRSGMDPRPIPGAAADLQEAVESTRALINYLALQQQM